MEGHRDPRHRTLFSLPTPLPTCGSPVVGAALSLPPPPMGTSQGTYKDAVLCKVCRHLRFRRDSFMDLSLVIKPFGSQEINSSVEAAIDFFVRPETMGEGNQVGHGQGARLG